MIMDCCKRRRRRNIAMLQVPNKLHEIINLMNYESQKLNHLPWVGAQLRSSWSCYLIRLDTDEKRRGFGIVSRWSYESACLSSLFSELAKIPLSCAKCNTLSHRCCQHNDLIKLQQVHVPNCISARCTGRFMLSESKNQQVHLSINTLFDTLGFKKKCFNNYMIVSVIFF